MPQVTVLGLSAFQHDASAALVVNGELRAHADQERFDGVKHSPSLPIDAAAYCARECGVNIADVSIVAFYMDPKIVVQRFFLEALSDAMRGGMGVLWRRALWTGGFLEDIEKLKSWLPGTIPLRFVRHHDAHAAYGFAGSPFAEACVATMDSIGEYVTTGAYLATPMSLRCRASVTGLDSLGYLYGAITEWLGFSRGDGEGTVMALSAMATPDQAIINDLVRIDQVGRPRLNRRLFEPRFGKRRGKRLTLEFERRYGPPRMPRDKLEPHHCVMAASLQRATEEAVLSWCRMAMRVTDSKNLCISGGVALNSVINRRLREEVAANLFVAPAAGDSGTSAGAALATSLAMGFTISAPDLVKLGPGYSDSEIEREVALSGVQFTLTADPPRTAARLIHEGQIIGWFQGRMEAGPRALGNRSILADPRQSKIKDIINYQVKHREHFRPFAASVLEVCQDIWFETRGTFLPYMLEVVPVREALRERIPAVLHVDGTCRIQSVRESSGRFYQLIREFYRLSGVPMVLNTSFNVKGMPIVRTPSDALRCFFSTGLDALVIGSCVLQKRDYR
jgi:carbamoyltransferase